MARAVPAWPSELKRPIVLDDLAIPRGLFSLADSKSDSERRLNEALAKVLGARISTLASFLRLPRAPDTEAEWIQLLFALCDHLGLPFFRVLKSKPRGAGASKKWTDEKLCQLFSDVQSLVVRGQTEHGACKFIAAHPGKFERRYSPPRKARPGDWGKTLHRQFLRAKRKAKDDFAFRMIFFGEGRGFLRPTPEYGPDLVRIAVERYAVARN